MRPQSKRYSSLPPSRAAFRLATLVLVALLCPSPASAEPSPTTFGGSVAVASDYVYRGISQTLGRPALQIGANAECDDFSFFFWGSNVDFGDDLAENELDFGLSWSPGVGDDWGLTFSLVHYVYPGDRSGDYSEALVDVEIGDLAIGFAVAPDYFGADVRAVYFQLGHGFSLPHGLELWLHAGYNAFDGEAPGERMSEYFDVAASLSRTYRSFTFDLTLSDTTLDDERQATTRIVASVLFSF